MKTVWFFGAVFLAFGATAVAQEKECRIGTPLAVDRNRPLASGEEIVESPGTAMPVAIEQLQSRGSTKIVSVLCLLPARTKIVVGGPFAWVKECGNNFTPRGWKLPPTTSQIEPPPKPTEPEKPVTEKKVTVERPANGDVNVNVKVDVHNNPALVQPRCITCDKPPKKSWIKRYWPVVVVTGGAAVLGGYLGARGGSGNQAPTPQPFKNPVTIISNP